MNPYACGNHKSAPGLRNRLRVRGTFFVVVLLATAATVYADHPPGLSGGDRYHSIFVTSTIHGVTSSATVPAPFPAFGSRDGADWIVTLGAWTAGRVPGWDGVSQDWKAMLSTSASSARSHVNIQGPVYNMAGQLVATGDPDLFDGTINNAVQYDEFGALVTTDLNVWTGSGSNGVNSGDNCGDWNDPTPGTLGEKGLASVVSGIWLDNGFQQCDQTARLYGVSPEFIAPHVETDTSVGTTGLQTVSVGGGLSNPLGMELLLDATGTGTLEYEAFQDVGMPPAGFQSQLGITSTPFDNGTFFDLTYDGTLTGVVPLTLEYDPSGLSLAEESTLALWQYDGTNWVDITSGLDTLNNQISGQMDLIVRFGQANQLAPLAISFNADAVVVPEPSTFLLAALGLLLPIFRSRSRC